MTTFVSDDVRLMSLVADRDPVAFAALHERFARPLFSHVFSIVRSHAAAQDVQQDVFEEIWERAGEFRASLGSPFSWIMTIARHKAIDRLRLEMRRLRQNTDFAALDSDPVTEIGGYETVNGAENAIRVRAAVAGLSVREREAIELSYYEGLTSVQIAGQLHEPLGTVKARVRRGLIHLRRRLAGLE